MQNHMKFNKFIYCIEIEIELICICFYTGEKNWSVSFASKQKLWNCPQQNDIQSSNGNTILSYLD